MGYKTIYENGCGEIVEKKSRFIAHVHEVKTEDEAIALIEQTRKQYWDARHNCWAYVLGGELPIERFSDDGEPQGTAGKPILEVLRGAELKNALIIVTRYFGGTLLGTGGLVRAYTQASQEGLKDARIIEKQSGVILDITCDYTLLGKIQYILAKDEIPVLDTQYTDSVVVKCVVANEDEHRIRAALTDASNGQAGIEKDRDCTFCILDKSPLLFED